MFGDNSLWVSTPTGEGVPRYNKGDIIELRDGKLAVVLGSSTMMLKVRPLRWWERLLMRLLRRST